MWLAAHECHIFFWLVTAIKTDLVSKLRPPLSGDWSHFFSLIISLSLSAVKNEIKLSHPEAPEANWKWRGKNRAGIFFTVPLHFSAGPSSWGSLHIPWVGTQRCAVIVVRYSTSVPHSDVSVNSDLLLAITE